MGSFAATRTPQRLRYVPRAGCSLNGSAADSNFSRRKTFRSKASQLLGEVFVWPCIVRSGCLRMNGRLAGRRATLSHRKECLDDYRVELYPGPFDEVFSGHVVGPSRPERTSSRQRAVCVGDTQYAGGKRRLFALNTVRIAAAAPPFVVPADDQLHTARQAQLGGVLLTNH